MPRFRLNASPNSLLALRTVARSICIFAIACFSIAPHTSLATSVPLNPGYNLDVLMVGDSITAGWRSGVAGSNLITDWNKVFPNYSVLNLGVPGTNTWGVESQINRAWGANRRPRVIVLLIGTNDSQGNTSVGQNVGVANRVKGNVDSLRFRFPWSRILVVSVPPQLGTPDVGWGNPLSRNPILQDLNYQIEAKVAGDSQVSFVNIWPGFFHADGRLNAGAFEDAVHLANDNTRGYHSQSGYSIYASALRDKLDAFMLLSNEGNQYPQVGTIPDVVLPSTGGDPEASVRVSLSDDQTPLSQLLDGVSVVSADTGFLPIENISMEAEVDGFVLHINPARSIGSSRVTLEIEDGGGLVSRREFWVFGAQNVSERVIYRSGFQNGFRINNTYNADINPDYPEDSVGGKVFQVNFLRANGLVNVNCNNVVIDNFDSIELQIHGGDIGEQELVLSVDGERKKLPRLPRGEWGRFQFSLRELKERGRRNLGMITIQEGAVRTGQVFSPGKPLSPLYIGEIVLKPHLGPQSAGPSIIGQPRSVTVWSGQTVTLSVQATGPGNLEYAWEQAPLRGSVFEPVPNAGNGPSLVVNTSTSGGSRQYRCVVRSAGGAVTSNPASIHVRTPFFTTQPANQTVPAGTQALFSVGFAGPTPVSYRWEYADANDTTFTPCAGSRHTSTWTTEPAGTSGGGNDGRRFRCVITFAPAFGSLTSDAALLNVTRPALPPTGGGAGGG
jgi:hypothetical protein